MYSTTHLILPEFLANDIFLWGEAHIGEDDLYLHPWYMTLGREYELHLTILGGLDISVPDEVKKLVVGIQDIEVELGLISVFTSNDLYDVVKLDVRSKGLRNLHKKLCRLSHTKFFPVYKPHVTIAYVGKGKGNDLVGQTAFNTRRWMADSIVFSSKRGTKTLISFKPPQV